MESTIELSAEALAYAKMYTGGFERRDLIREVFEEWGSNSWTLPEFLNVINEAVEAIPEEHRPNAKVELEGGYDESTSLKITYEDAESDAELNARIQQAISAALNREAQQRREFERLKAKYEKEPK